MSAAEWATVRGSFADDRYADAEPLLRVATKPGGLLIAAHHGAVDGFGLLALLGIALDVPVASDAVGIGNRPASRSFLASGALRVGEALFAPPSRAAASGGSGRPGDAISRTELPAVRAGSAALTAATAAAVRRWNHGRGARAPRVVAALGASRRPGTDLAPDRRTAYFRLRIPPTAGPAAVRHQVDVTAPEPDFPPSRGTLARPVIRALTSRLGATFLISNLGVVRAAPVLETLWFYPAASGRHGLAIGAATCGGVTTVTLRARRTGFGEDAAEEILAGIVAELTGSHQRSGTG